jgi:hypothetical protein
MKKNIFHKRFFLAFFVTISCLTSCRKEQPAPGDSYIMGVVLDAVTFQPIAGATISLEPLTATLGSSAGPSVAETDLAGKYIFNSLPSGKYNLHLKKDNYEAMFSRNITLNASGAFVAMLPALTSLTVPIGGISGIITNADGLPLKNANVAVSAQNEEITNGYFSSATTNEYGHFYIGAIPLQSTTAFKIRCIAEGHHNYLLNNVDISKNEMITFNVKMEKAPQSVNLFHEGFEVLNPGWEMTGFWNIHDNRPLINPLYPSYVKSAPNDVSGSVIPLAFKGKKMAWYGNAIAGNYLGTQSMYDYELSGGTSTGRNFGTMTSPAINLQGLNQASINFWSWFEIESVNPNKTGYDLMEVFAIDPSGKAHLLGKLNPYTDPIIRDRKSIPYTSGGFNQAPVWKYHEFDLTDFAGSQIRLRFSFDTRDGLFNGFRGWFIDEIKISNVGIPNTKSNYDPPPLMERKSE